MVIVALVVAIPVTLLIRSDDDEAPAPARIETPPLGEPQLERSLGVKLQLPDGWRSKTKREVMELRSQDKGTRITISAPGPAADAGDLYDETLAELRRSFKSFKVLKELKRQELGGLRSQVATVEAVPRGGGGETRLLISTAPGKKSAYLVVVATSGSGSGESLVEAQALLNELKLVG